MAVIQVEGKNYTFEDLSETARNQVSNLQAADQEIARLQSLVTMLQAARTTYGAILRRELESATPLEDDAEGAEGAE